MVRKKRAVYNFQKKNNSKLQVSSSVKKSKSNENRKKFAEKKVDKFEK